MPMVFDPLAMLLRILHVISFSVEIYVRREFGERYIGWLHFLFTLILLSVIISVFRFLYFLPLIGGGVYPQISGLYWYGVIFMTGYHMLRIWQRNRQNIPWHSRSPGISFLSFLPVDDWVLYRFIEPALCILMSMVIRLFVPFTGNWLLLASVCLLIKNNIIFNIARGRVLDVIDAQIETKVMSGELAGNDKRQTAGWSSIMVMPALPESISDASTALPKPDQSDFAALVQATLEAAVTPSENTVAHHEQNSRT